MDLPNNPFASYVMQRQIDGRPQWDALQHARNDVTINERARPVHPYVRQEGGAAKDAMNHFISPRLFRRTVTLQTGAAATAQRDELPQLTSGDNFDPAAFYASEAPDSGPVSDYGDRLELRGSVRDTPTNSRRIASDFMNARVFARVP